MSGDDAYEDEMAFLNRPDPGYGELAAFAQSLRATLVRPVPPAGQAAMAVRLAEETRIARAEQPTAPLTAPRRHRRLRLAAQAAFAIVLVPLAGAGLAVAGVNLPGPAQSAFEKVGIELPNQADSAGDEPATEPAGQPGGEAPGGSDAAPTSPPSKGNGGANGKAKGKGQSKPSGPGGQPGAVNGNGNANGKGKGKSQGKSGQAPGQSDSPGNAGGNGKEKAVGKTGATPPGRVNRPPDPGKSGKATDKLK